jgi:thioredoxin-dependent peroxiredoxin
VQALKKVFGSRWSLCLLVFASAGLLRAEEEYRKIIYLRIGDPAPAFKSVDDQGQAFKSSSVVGRKVTVVYFYLGDFFPADVKQACAYRDVNNRLNSLGAEVIGVSGDEAANHQLFKKTYRLNFKLLADKEGEVGKVFGVSMSGGGEQRLKDRQGQEIVLRRGCTPSRWTFVIDKRGRIAYKNTNPKPEEDARKVLEVVEKLYSEEQ